MERKRPVVLVGPMAVGKSAVGRIVAQRTGARLVDSDRVIVERHGPISTIFAQQGEPAFRELEAEVIREALADDDVVVSLGGGAVLHPQTRALLREATVVFLDTDLATVRPRISGDTGRPLLTGRPEDRWQELYDERRPVYAALASLVVDTRGLSVRGAADAVLQALPPGRAQSVAGDAAPCTDLTDLTDESVTNPHDD